MSQKRRESLSNGILRLFQHSLQLEHQGEITESNLRRILSETQERVEGRRLAHPTVKEWLEQWIETRKGAISDRTRLKYLQVKDDFLASLGRRSNAKLESIGLKDFLEFRNRLLAEGRTPQTVDQLVRKILASPFTLAVKLGMLDSNPLAHLPPLRSTRMEKGVFGPEEIAKLVECASGDWKGLILAGYYTGGRLSDLARLIWANVDLVEKTISFRQKKTEGKSVRAKLKIPIHPELERYLLSGPISDNPSAAVFPELYGKPGTGRSGLSTQFKRIMEKAGVEAGIGRLRAGKKERTFSWRSFHSLRHSFISALANSGVSSELRQRLSGHASEEMHAIYTHHELETMRQAVGGIPRLTGK
jgi:integrase